jgi:cephalosporin-C deacetylase-like acetyl esterase
MKKTLFIFLVGGSLLAACSRKPENPPAAFYLYNQNLPLSPQVEVVGDSADFSLYHVTYRSVHDFSVTGLYAVPKSAAGPRPAIIFLHGINDSKSVWYMEEGNRIFCQNGYAVLRIDVYRHGERRQPEDTTRIFPYLKQDLISQTVFDLRRAADFLATRTEIDTARLGYFGISLGGFIGVVFTGVEPRIKVPVIALAGGGISLLLAPETIGPDNKETRRAIEPLNFIEAISPRPLLMLNASRDDVVPPPASKALYAKAREPKQIIWYDTKHRDVPTGEAFAEGVRWFDQHLK